MANCKIEFSDNCFKQKRCKMLNSKVRLKQEAAEKRRLEAQKEKRQKSEERDENKLLTILSSWIAGEAEVEISGAASEAGGCSPAGGRREVHCEILITNLLQKYIFSM